MKIVRKELKPGQVAPTNLRYDPTCDCVQRTPDGGTTWIDTPSADPRHAEDFRLPPLTGEDARCDAAARQAAAWQEVYDNFIASTSALQFATIILSFLLVLAGGAGVLLTLIFLTGDALIAIGKSNMEAAFDSDTWDGIMCIIYCHIDENGQVSQAQLDAIYADILDAYPGVVYNTLVEIGHLMGDVLLSNASVERDETGDCTDCTECCDGTFCYTWALPQPQTNTADHAWWGYFGASYGNPDVLIDQVANTGNPGGLILEHFEADVTWNGLGATPGLANLFYVISGNDPLNPSNWITLATVNPLVSGVNHVNWDGSQDVGWIGVQAVLQNTSGGVLLTLSNVNATGQGCWGTLGTQLPYAC